MVRYKFPGKPSKFSNRTLVNAKCSAAHENDSARAATLICYGLSLFTKSFGPDEDETDDFTGFSSQVIERTKERARTRIAEIEEEHKSRGVVFLPLDKQVKNKYFLLSTDTSISDKHNCSFKSENTSDHSVVSADTEKVSVKKGLVAKRIPSVKRLGTNSNSNDNKSDRKKCFKTNHDVVRKGRRLNSKNFGIRRTKLLRESIVGDKKVLNYKVKKGLSLKANNTRSRSEEGVNGCCDKSQDGLVVSGCTFTNGNYNKKNFVLPSHSVRSSRVIKPNKRFLDGSANDVSGISSGSSISSSSSTSGYECNGPPVVATTSSIELKKPRLLLGPNHEFPDFTWSRSRDDSAMVSDVESESSSLQSSSVTSSSSGSSIAEPPPKKKVILRKPRLNIDMPSTSDAVFKSGAIRGKIVCGVCGAVRFYRFVRQARKFGIYSCEPCRKFVSTMINNLNQKVKCLGEKGQCHMPPVMRTIIWDSKKQMIGKVRNLRCHACWLKMCIKCYFMPEQLKVRLNNKLPIFMRDPILCMKKIKMKRRMYSSNQIVADIDSTLAGDSGNVNERLISLRETRLRERIRRKNAVLRITRKRSDSSVTRDKEMQRRNCRLKWRKQNASAIDSNEDNSNESETVDSKEKSSIKKKSNSNDGFGEDDSFGNNVNNIKSVTASSGKRSDKVSSVVKLEEKGSKHVLLPRRNLHDSVTKESSVDEKTGIPVLKKRGRKKTVHGASDSDKLVPKLKEGIRQKRKAALNSLANIARVTGRVTDSAVGNQLIVARNLKKKAAAIARKESADSNVSTETVTEVKKNRAAIGIKYRRRGKVNTEKRKQGRRGGDDAPVNKSNRNSGSGSSVQGPRVKHVCRSASLVLGRQIATFTSKGPPVKTKQQDKQNDSLPIKELKVASLSDSSNNCGAATTELEPDSNQNKTEDASSLLPQLPSATTTSAVAGLSLGSGPGRMRQLSTFDATATCKDDVGLNGKGKPKTSYARTLQDLGRQNCELLDGIGKEAVTISVDFWESYDPDEVGKTGFALIGCDASFRVSSLCFLCGSAGIDKMVHCVCCCEPYHLYCVEGGVNDYLKLQRSRLWWRVDWVCPRCAICSICNKGDGHHVTCNKCRKSYHADCLPHDKIVRVHATDRPWVCHSCLKCKSCNAMSVAMFVGNIPLCNSCFKLRQKGSFCPLCQRCYDEDDFDTSMMECGKCKSWVHAKCEGLSSEKYQVLSFLPDSVEFICRLCCTTPPAPWWSAVEAELNAGYLNVLKSLTKNRKICELLKYSPKKRSEICTCQNPSPKKNRISARPLLSLSETVSECTDQYYSLHKRPDTLLSDKPLVPDCSENVCSCENKSETMCLGNCFTNLSSSIEMKPNIEDSLVSSNAQLSKSDRDNINVKSVSSVVSNSVGDPKAKTSVVKDYIVPTSVSTSDELHIRLGENDQQVVPVQPGLYSCLENKIEQFSPHATSQSDSGIGSTDDELKMSVDDGETIAIATDILSIGDSVPCCRCSEDSERLSALSPSLLRIKNKVNCSEYVSLQIFHNDVQKVVESIRDSKLLDFYYQILQDNFPWFDPRCCQVSTLSRNDNSALSDYSYANCDPRKRRVDHKKEEAEAKMNKETDYFEDMSVVLNELLGLPQSYYYYNSVDITDCRVCVLCKTVGDAASDSEGRLLYCGHNEWIHANCALWSNEVYEEIDGSLQRVHSAISRSRLIRCAFCDKRGATVGCCYRNCPESYHFPCAIVAHCVFMEDKSIYCYLHQTESKSKPLSKQSDFAITRPIYVELIDLEKKKKKSVARNQVKVMIGSLMVESLGEFVAEVSDQQLCLIPCDFVCTRMFWSCVEPWRLVRYHIRTKIIHSNQDYSLVKDDNFTVDHSLDLKSNTCAEKDVSNVSVSGACTSDNEVKRVLDSVVDAVCHIGSGGKDEENLGNLITDPQNSADLLPPELKDAIFEDLPKDILDGISMQDIFPKMMTYDDSVEKNDGSADSSSTDSKSSTGRFVQNKCQKSRLNAEKSSDKADVPKQPSLTNTVSSESQTLRTDEKPKAVVKPESNKSINLFMNRSTSDTEDLKVKTLKPDDGAKKHGKILQVDGTLDYSSGDSDVGSPNKCDLLAGGTICNPVLFVRIQNATDNLKDMETNCIRPKNILQVDGCVDSNDCGRLATGNSSQRRPDFSDSVSNWDYQIPQLDGMSDCNVGDSKDAEEKPVKCLRCHRTYRTAVSYERHLSTCHTDYMSCSESDSSEEEKASSPLNEYCSSGQSVCNSVSSVNAATETTESTNEANEISESSSSSTVSVDSIGMSESTNLLNEATDSAASADLVEPNSDFCQGAEDVVEYVVQTSESTDGVQQSTCINSALYKEEVDNPVNMVNPDNNSSYAAIISTSDEHSEIELPANVNVVYMPENMDNCILIKVDNESKLIESPATSNTYYIADSNNSHGNVILDKPHSLEKNVRMTTVHEQQPIVDYQTPNPTLIIQQVAPQSSVMPTYIDAFSQQSTAIQPQQNIQYITIDTGEKAGSQYQSAVLSNSYQIQPPAPSVQTVVPTVVGTIIQPNGVEQLILNTNPPDMFHRQQQQTGSMYISSPPQMYMNMETVVSNTVMSSSRFVSVPGSVPGGMLSTYSATTTQVFQAAKPVIDVPAQSYLVINTSPTVGPATGINNSTQQINTVQQFSHDQAHTSRGNASSDQWSGNRSHNKYHLSDQSVKEQFYRQEKPDATGHRISVAERSTVFIEPQFTCNKVASLKNEQLKITQNAQKINPVHHLSKMVDSIQNTSTRKICLNNLMTRQKPPEAKVIPQPKIIDTAIQHLNSFEDKLNKTIVNPFHLSKPKDDGDRCSVVQNSNLKSDIDSVVGTGPADRLTDKPSSPIKKQIVESLNEVKDCNISVNRFTDQTLDLKNKLSNDQLKVIVEPILAMTKTETVLKDNYEPDPSKTADNANKVRTYGNSKKRPLPVEPCALTQQMKEHFKSQMIKEFNKNNIKHNATSHHLSEDTNGVRVLQPTLKENKILDKVKFTLENEGDIPVKRNKQLLDRKSTDAVKPVYNNNVSKRELRASEKTIKPKSDKLKRKDNCHSSNSEPNLKKPGGNQSVNDYNSSPNMVFEIKSEDGFSCMTPNLADAWQKVYDAVQASRAAKKMPPIPRNPYRSVNSLLKMLGLGNNSLKYVLEQLPGVERSVKYRPSYHKNLRNFIGLECVTKENTSGCARSEPYTTRNKYDMFSWLASRHRRPPKLLVTSDTDIINGNRRATSLNLPMAMRFRHLGKTSKEAVGVFRSDIHGRGLFCLRDIDSGEMVIEYAGEVIRSALTDKRERYYTSKGIGCYMFRIDDNFVVDATMKGNAARFINHSCEPNCYSRVVDILGKKHILIFALRRIPKGEELTYDYKFPLEDDKITCHCLSRKCRKYLN